MTLESRLRVVLVTCGVAALLWSSAASAGNGLQPAAGSTTGPAPTFVVALDPADSAALVHVATSAQVDSAGSSPDEIGSCVPTSSLATPGAYACAPSTYRTTGTSSLQPGVYDWWLTYTATDPGQPAPTTHVSGPFAFTVAAPARPDVVLQSPASGATTSATPSLVFRVPAGLGVDVYVSDRAGDAQGAPAARTYRHCAIAVTAAATYHCDVSKDDGLVPGRVYYWWLVARGDGAQWVFGPSTFVVRAPRPRGPADAPSLPSSAHFAGKSVKQTRLSGAAYALSKVIGAPKSVAVACWSAYDWRSIAGDNPESGYSVLGFWQPSMPHWLELSPGICSTLETLTYKRPRFANRFTANAVDTLTHEMIHALGVHDEAMTECFSMQLLWLTSRSLGVPLGYAENLSKLSLENYGLHPPRYVNRAACRENGAWDLFKNRPSLPWHTLQV